MSVSSTATSHATVDSQTTRNPEGLHSSIIATAPSIIQTLTGADNRGADNRENSTRFSEGVPINTITSSAGSVPRSRSFISGNWPPPIATLIPAGGNGTTLRFCLSGTTTPLSHQSQNRAPADVPTESECSGVSTDSSAIIDARNRPQESSPAPILTGAQTIHDGEAILFYKRLEAISSARSETFPYKTWLRHCQTGVLLPVEDAESQDLMARVQTYLIEAAGQETGGYEWYHGKIPLKKDGTLDVNSGKAMQWDRDGKEVKAERRRPLKVTYEVYNPTNQSQSRL